MDDTSSSGSTGFGIMDAINGATQDYLAIEGARAPIVAAAPAGSTVPTSSTTMPAFNWKPWAVGAGALLAAAGIFTFLRPRRS